MAKNKYGLGTKKWTREFRITMASVEAYLGAAGFSAKEIAANPAQLFAVIANVYGVTTAPTSDFQERIVDTHRQIKDLSHKQRSNLQKNSRARLSDIGKRAFGEEMRTGWQSDPLACIRVSTASKPMMPTAPAIVSAPSGKHKDRVATKDEFYKSWEWRTLRMEALKKHGARCQCCGASRDDRTMAGELVRICVDHIKPLSTHWHLRLEPTNLQILCDECNQGKGAWDSTDWRIDEAIRTQLKYEI